MYVYIIYIYACIYDSTIYAKFLATKDLGCTDFQNSNFLKCRPTFRRPLNPEPGEQYRIGIPAQGAGDI